MRMPTRNVGVYAGKTPRFGAVRDLIHRFDAVEGAADQA